jgi:hypothetical protein
MHRHLVTASLVIVLSLSLAPLAHGQGLLTPAPAGFKTFVTYPGAFVDAGNGIATVLTCSSVDPKPIRVRIQLFSLFGGDLAGETETTLEPGQTFNAETSGTIFLPTVVIPSNLKFLRFPRSANKAHLVALQEAIEEVGHEGVQAMGPNPSAGLPEDLHGRGHGGAVLPRAPGARAGRRRPRWAP